MFEDIAEELSKREADCQTDHFHVYAELQHKLTQIELVYHQIQLLCAHVEQEISTERINFNTIGTLEIFSETFYHFAWRIEEIIKKNKELFTGEIKKSNVNKVRNQLLQHPEGQKGKKLYPTFSADWVNGPKIKAYIGPEHSFQDPGLFINASDFKEKFLKILDVK